MSEIDSLEINEQAQALANFGEEVLSEFQRSAFVKLSDKFIVADKSGKFKYYKSQHLALWEQIQTAYEETIPDEETETEDQ